MAKSAAVLLGFVVLCGAMWWLALASQGMPMELAPEEHHSPAQRSAPAVLPDSRLSSVAAASREALAPSAESEPGGPATAPAATLRGTVTDEEGRPVAGARVVATRVGQPFQVGSARSTADGSFAVERFEREATAEDSQVALHCDHAGYEPWHGAPVAWGASGVRLVLRRGKTLVVEVVDAGDGTPVDPCQVAVLLPGGFGMFFGQAVVVARPGPGLVLLAPVVVGRHVIVVVPNDGRHARVCHEVTLLERQEQREVVRVPVARRRPLEVVDAARRGVPGTVFDLVEVLDPSAKRLFPGAELDAVRGGFVASIRMIAGATDAEGKSALIAASGQRYALGLNAPGRAQMIVRDVLVDEALGPLVVTLAYGATLAGRIGPDDVIEQMWRSDAELATGKIYRPALWLVPLEPAAGGSTQGATGDGHIPLARDGTFAFGGVAPGSFRVFMYWYDEKGTAHHERLGVVEGLLSGERRELAITLEHLRRVELAGCVLLDGAPFAGQSVRLAGTGRDHEGEPRRSGPVEVKTDARGAFVASVEPGTWHAELQVKTSRPERPWPRLCSDALEVPPGRSARVTFQAHALKLVVTLVDASGAPAAGQSVACRHEQIGVLHCGRTDERGVVEADPLCPGKAELFWERPRKGPEAKGWPQPVSIGTVELRADRPVSAVTFRLPQD